MVLLYLARHGETQENLSRVFQGHLPGTLTEKGKEQARRLGRKLEGIPLDAVVSSDLLRAVDTVRLAVGGRHLPCEETALLREADWGSWTGRPLEVAGREDFPSDAETRADLYRRAGEFLQWLCRRYEGRRVLAVAHGLINRSIEARAKGLGLEDVSAVSRMENGEVRVLSLNGIMRTFAPEQVKQRTDGKR